MTVQASGYALTPAELRILAMVLAECKGQGFDERGFWTDEEAHRDFLWICDVIFMWNRESREQQPTNHAHGTTRGAA